MALDPAGRRPVIGRGKLIATLSLLAFVVFCLASSWSGPDATTRLSLRNRPASATQPPVGQAPLVDLSPWETAHALASLAVTRDELDLAQQAERLADHEVDQAFASALREAGLQHKTPTGKALVLQQKLPQLEQTMKDDQARLDALSRSNAAEEDLDIAKAQLGLDSDVLADTRQDLARAGGDQRGTIQQELAAHEASMKAYDSQARAQGSGIPVAATGYDSLASRAAEWREQRRRGQRIAEAMNAAETGASDLAARHNQLETQAQTSSSPDTPSSKLSTLSRIRNRSAQSQLLSILDDRFQTQRQLAAVYRNWSEQLRLQHRMMLDLILQALAMIALVVICGLVMDAFVIRFVTRPAIDRRRMQTLQIIFKIGVQVTCVLLILLVIFGVPRQMPTILGLTTAGLTVVFQDFIIAFFGWFILMGKSGIRVGDWVEINGVGGEVTEIGVFRTALLETGNSTVKGHPTGRRVTFINSFAIKGQYFNFSTTGQWMWDEIRIGIPATGDVFAMVEIIRQAVGREMESTSRIAGEEWRRVTQSIGLNQFTAEPAVDLRPGSTGIDIIVRYVTRASERFEVRNRLYECVINLLHKPVPQGVEAPARV